MPQKQFAPEYRENQTHIPMSNLSVDHLHDTVDFTYQTHSGTKTIRCKQAYNNDRKISDDLYTFYYQGDKYAFDVNQKRLVTVDRNRDKTIYTIAQEEDITEITLIEFPTRAPVVGAIDEDITATIYYHSSRSDNILSTNVRITGTENDVVFHGTQVESGDRIKAVTIHERRIEKTVANTTLGRVARIEFPRGQQFVVDIESLTEETVNEENITERIEETLSNNFYLPDDQSLISVEHSKELDWEQD